MPLLFPFVPRKGAPLPIPMERVVSPAHHEPARSVCEHPRPLSAHVLWLCEPWAGAGQVGTPGQG